MLFNGPWPLLGLWQFQSKKAKFLLIFLTYLDIYSSYFMLLIANFPSQLRNNIIFTHHLKQVIMTGKFKSTVLTSFRMDSTKLSIDFTSLFAHFGVYFISLERGKYSDKGWSSSSLTLTLVSQQHNLERGKLSSDRLLIRGIWFLFYSDDFS